MRNYSEDACTTLFFVLPDGREGWRYGGDRLPQGAVITAVTILDLTSAQPWCTVLFPISGTIAQGYWHEEGPITNELLGEEFMTEWGKSIMHYEHANRSHIDPDFRQGHNASPDILGAKRLRRNLNAR